MNYDEWLVAEADRYWSQVVESDKDQAEDTGRKRKSNADYYRELNKQLLAQAADHSVDANK
mgnify:FL=1